MRGERTMIGGLDRCEFAPAAHTQITCRSEARLRWNC
jgi:hypothetical protein